MKSILLAFTLTGCVSLSDAAHRSNSASTMRLTTVPDAAHSAECDHYSSAHRAWVGVAVVTGFLSGTGGVSTALPTDQVPRLAIGISSLAIGALSALSTTMASSYANDFVQHQCGTSQ